jgi:hypothetical protein
MSTSSYGFPSSTHVDLTLGDSGSTYTAPANGWITVSKGVTAANQYFYMISNRIATTTRSVGSAGNIETFLPVSKGATISVSYNTAGTTNNFRFIYAGEV